MHVFKSFPPVAGLTGGSTEGGTGQRRQRWPASWANTYYGHFNWRLVGGFSRRACREAGGWGGCRQGCRVVEKQTRRGASQMSVTMPISVKVQQRLHMRVVILLRYYCSFWLHWSGDRQSDRLWGTDSRVTCQSLEGRRTAIDQLLCETLGCVRRLENSWGIVPDVSWRLIFWWFLV